MSATYDDLELAELDKEIKRRGTLLKWKPNSHRIYYDSIEREAESLTDAEFMAIFDEMKGEVGADQ